MSDTVGSSGRFQVANSEKFWFIGRCISVSYQRVDVMGDIYLLILSLWHAECHLVGAPMYPNRTKNLFFNRGEYLYAIHCGME